MGWRCNMLATVTTLQFLFSFLFLRILGALSISLPTDGLSINDRACTVRKCDDDSVSLILYQQIDTCIRPWGMKGRQ